MSEECQGASTTSTGLSPTVEPVPVSPPDGASIPSAIADDRRMILRALHDARLQLEYLDSRWPTGTTPAVIQRVSAALRDALPWATLSMIYAQAIEARRAETGTGSVHESAVAEGDAPTPSSPNQS